MRRLLGSMLGQIALVIASTMLATSLLLTALVYVQNLQAGAPWPWAIVHRVVSLVNLLESVPQDKLRRVTLLAAAQRPNLSLSVVDAAKACSGWSAEAYVLELALRSELPQLPALKVAACDSDDAARNIQVLVPIGRHLVDIRTGTLGYHPFRFASPLFGAVLFLSVSVLALSIWAIWRLVLPLRRLSDTVEAFARDVSPAPIVEEGPLEIRNVARTVNVMQERISGLIDDRTRMLAAVSHDLRTPLTRMRLQLERPDGRLDGARLRRNVDVMQGLVDSALAFLAGGHAGEASEWVDLDALLATVCDEYEESGADVRYEGPGHIRFHCRPVAFQRAVGNLIDNAIAHGGAVQVTAAQDAQGVRIDIADDGPGIPEAQLEQVLQPFVRLDGRRDPGNGSIGLGLSIVEGIVRAQGGQLSLANRAEGGLLARLAFPAVPPQR